MSSETPPGPSQDRPTEPFTRGRIQWGRPPQAVFQVGPLPKSKAAPLAARPMARGPGNAGTGILSGSMIPRARPAGPAPVEAPEIETVVFEPEPVVAPPAPQEIVVEPEATGPALTVPPPLSSDVEPTAEPRSLPSVVVTPSIQAPVGAARQKMAGSGRWPIVAAVAAIVVIGGFIWLATLPAATPPVAADAAPVAAVPLVEEASSVEAAPAPAAAAPVPEVSAPVAPAAAPVIAPARRPEPSPTAPITVAPRPADAARPPAIEVAPLVVDPPTPAAPAPTNPDAPIATQPQPLD